MKKTYIYLIIAGASLLALNSCSKEQETDIEDKPVNVVTGAGESITFQFNVPVSADTKTALGTKDGSSYPVKWSNGDQNRVSLNGSAPTSSTKDSDTQITAAFKPGSLSVYNFLYRGDAGHDNQVTTPASQAYYANDFDDAAMPMYAASASRNNTVTFNSLCSLLKFSITGSKKIDSVTLTAVDGSKSLSGTFTIGKTSNLLNGTLTPASGGGTINYNFGSHVQLSDTPFVFYVAIPAGTYEGGITLNIVDNSSGHMTATVMNTNATKTIAAGKVREFNNIVYIPDVAQNLKQIWDATTFQEFVTEVAGGNKTLNARLTPNASSINLSSIAGSFESIEDYKGTFDGNGKTLTGLTKPMFNDLKGVVKNLTLNSTISITDAEDYNLGIFARQVVPSSEIDDIAGLQNCTANGSITYTPSSSLSLNPSLGGMVGNNRGGALANCTNNATVSFGDNGGVTHTGDRQPSIGGIVGRTQKGGDLSTQGDISNCTNTGTVSCDEQFGGNIQIGGIVGYGVEKAESISGCTNSGLVKAAATCSTSGALHIGGVMGMYKGTIESCSNLAAGTVTTEACSVGTYLCQGGVVGRMNNTSGTYTGLTNAGTVNVAATDASSNAYVGGVVGRCNEGAAITGFSNSGNINCSSTGFEDDLFIGGIVASNETSGNVLQNCNSTGGTLSYTGALTNGNLYIGGVVGYSTKEVANCTSAMTLNVGGDITPEAGSKYYCTGGIVGSMSQNAPITNCLNTGNITLSQLINEVSGKEGYTRLGGIVGRTEGRITNCSNGGIVTFSGKNHCDKGNPMVGGVVGDTADNSDISISGKYSSATATNYGNVVINTTAQTKKYVYAGGVVGRLRCSVTATNAGQINVTSLKCTALYAGGIVGSALTDNASLSSCQNLAAGDFNISGLNSSNSSYTSYVGGIVGYAENSSITFSGCTNAGDVILTSGSKAAGNLLIGGIAGASNCPVSNCTNNGLVSNAAPVNGTGAWLDVGGILGYSTSSAHLSDCSNTVAITNTAASKGYIMVAGISAECESNISSCTNSGAITNSGAALTQKATDKIYHIGVGGVTGRLYYGHTLTSCSNSNAVSNTGNSGAGIFIGGVAGYTWQTDVTATACTFVTCSNTGAISNSGYAYDSAIYNDVGIGGIVGCLYGVNTLTGTSSAYNYNNGTVEETSTSGYVGIGGVVGHIYGAGTDLTYAKNLAGGDITLAHNTRTRCFVGGVLGCAQTLFTMDDASNAGDLNFADLTITGKSYSTIEEGSLDSGRIFIGGVFGGFTKRSVGDDAATYRRLSNTGNITCPGSASSTGVYNMLPDISTNCNGYSIIAGVAAPGYVKNKTFLNCTNSGQITIYNGLKTCIGGVIGYTNVNPDGCTNTGRIRYYRGQPALGDDKKLSGECEVGGVVGEVDDLTTMSNLTNDATISTANGYPVSYTGGIAGWVNNGMVGFSYCNVGVTNGVDDADRHTITGGGGGTLVHKSGAGLFAGADTQHAWDFSGCIVKTGTKCQNITITDDNLNDALIGRGKTPTSITNPPTIGSF